jgi:CRISPR-associated endonuclease/helicase Cas3
MIPRILYAKSAGPDQEKITLLEHTRAVVENGEALLNATQQTQLEAFGLDPAIWGTRFRTELLFAALLHDLGKANSYFQTMIVTRGMVRQPIRHEAVSYWIARQQPMKEWLQTIVGAPDAMEFLLWAVAGHHRKFPPELSNDNEPMLVFLGHNDFRQTLSWGAKRLGLPDPPVMEDQRLVFNPERESVSRGFKEAAAENNRRFRPIKRQRSDEQRYIALLKACLIAADVAGSVRWRGPRAIADWIPEAFANVPTSEQLAAVVDRKRGVDTLRDFQTNMGTATERVVFVNAGCGSGKTLGAYHWAAKTAERLGRGLRVFFCYPTTGTASEGYRDYLKDIDLPAELIHGRADVDMKLLSLGDDDPSPSNTSDSADEQPGRAAEDSAGALEQWSTPLVSCTVDTVLGLMQNHRRGIYLWPSIAGSAIVFDEIHSYDDELFSALLRFLREMRKIPCLLMTASLPEHRLRRLEDELGSIGESLGRISGPESLETIKRYHLEPDDDPWPRVEATLNRDEKVLWVVNKVEQAMDLYDNAKERRWDPLIYHSRFRYEHRVKRHAQVVEAFGKYGRVIAFCTQVAELSLDLSANLLVTQLAPISALIQRLGRLNRRATKDAPWPFIVYRPTGSPAPYKKAELDEAEAWLAALSNRDLTQRDLVEQWESGSAPDQSDSPSSWLDGGFETRSNALREGSPGIEIILPDDVDSVRSGRSKPVEVRVPMNMPRVKDWHLWDEVAMCKVPPANLVEYDPEKGAKWTR